MSRCKKSLTEPRPQAERSRPRTWASRQAIVFDQTSGQFLRRRTTRACRARRRDRSEVKSRMRDAEVQKTMRIERGSSISLFLVISAFCVSRSAGSFVSFACGHCAQPPADDPPGRWKLETLTLKDGSRSIRGLVQSQTRRRDRLRRDHSAARQADVRRHPRHSAMTRWPRSSG